MTTDAREPRSQTSAGYRRIGYVVAILVNAAVLYAANQWPGWDVLPFLSDTTPEVLGIVNVSLVVGIILNAVYIAADPPRLRALGDVVTMSIGIAVLARIWQVFPFDFGDPSSPWETVVRVLLVLGIVGSGIGIVVALVTLIRGGPRRD
jgi:hypothetical protein